MAIQITLQAAASLLLGLFIPVAIASSRCYRLSRTAWRGIRFSFQGKTLDFIKLWLSGYFLTGVTLGLYDPYFSTKKHAFLTAHSYFGSEPFTFSGEGAALFRPFLMMYLPAVSVAVIAGLGLYFSIQQPLQNIAAPPNAGRPRDRSGIRLDYRRDNLSSSLATLFSEGTALLLGADIDRFCTISAAHHRLAVSQVETRQPVLSGLYPWACLALDHHSEYQISHGSVGARRHREFR